MVEVKQLSETNFTIENVVNLIHQSFKQWTVNGIESAVASYTINEFSWKNCIILVAFNGNDLLGTCTLEKRIDNRKENLIFGKYFAVSPNNKKQGIGSMLLEKEKQIAIEKHCSYILADTSEHAYWSIKWHKKNGFNIIGLRSFKTNNYYSYLFRYQLKPHSIYNSNLYCFLIYTWSSFKTKLLKKRNGEYTILGKIIHFFI